MNLRPALYELAHQHQLDDAATAKLFGMAGLAEEPAALRRWLWPVVAVLGAALGGLGVIVWLAANWESLGRAGRFGLLQALVLAACTGAWARPSLRAPLGLLALLGIGGLFAYFGQTYQTGADPWQLFALWAALALPLCLGVRSDVLWAPWALVVSTGISLWVHAHTGHEWRVRPEDLPVFGAGFAAAALLVAALASPLQRFTGAGAWAQRTAGTLAVIMITLTAIGGLFHRTVAPHYLLGLAVLAVAAVVLSRPRLFEIFVLSAVTLGINALLVGGLIRLLFEGKRSDIIGSLFLVGLVAAGLLAVSVSLIMRLARREAARGHP